MRVTVLNLKGGTGKTITAVYLAGGLARHGRTLLIDADPQRSALSWSEAAGGFAFPVISLLVRDLATRVGSLGEGYAHIVIDTPRAMPRWCAPQPWLRTWSSSRYRRA